MKKIIFALVAILLVLVGTLLFVLSENYLTGKITEEENSDFPYSYTKAICNETNFCQDYIIECQGKKTKKITATGYSVQHSDKWKDQRNNPNSFCK